MADYSEYIDKRVMLTKTAGEPFEGRVVSGNALGVIIKPKGKTNVQLVEAADISEIEVLPDAPKRILQKKMAPIELSGVRQHLALYHGVSLETLNQPNYTDESAQKYHDSIDHSGLGHNHDRSRVGAQMGTDEGTDETAAA